MEYKITGYHAVFNKGSLTKFLVALTLVSYNSQPAHAIEPVTLTVGAVVGGAVLNEMLSSDCEVSTQETVTQDGITYTKHGCMDLDDSPFAEPKVVSNAQPSPKKHWGK